MNISKKFLVSLRGRQSARALSQKLGYSSNQISRWESGHSRFSWSDFVDLCERLELPLQEAFTEMEFHSTPDDLKAILQYFVPGKKTQEIAKICGVSALTIQRWQKKTISPLADKIFQLFSISGTPLSPFIHKLLGPKKISPQLAKILETEQNRIGAALETPWTISIACLCLLDPIKGLSLHQSLRQISKQIDLEVSKTTDIVTRLIRARILGFNEETNQFYLPEGPAHFEFRNSLESFFQGAKFWAQFSAQMTGKNKSKELGENHISYLVFTCRSQEIKNIHDKIITLYKELADLSQQSDKNGPPDRALSFCVSLHDVNQPGLGQAIQQWKS